MSVDLAAAEHAAPVIARGPRPNTPPPQDGDPAARGGTRSDRPSTVNREQATSRKGGHHETTRQIGHSPEAERQRKERQIPTHTRAQIRKVLEARVNAAQTAQAENKPIGRVDMMLLQQFRNKEQDQDSFFARLENAEMDQADMALMWMGLAMSEVSLRSAVGEYGVEVVDDYARLDGIRDRRPRERDREIRQVTFLRGEIEKTLYRGFRIPLIDRLPGQSAGVVPLSREFFNQRGRMGPDDQGFQDGNAFHNAIARRLQDWNRDHPDRDWRGDPYEAQAILHGAYADALSITADRYAQQLYDDPDAAMYETGIRQRIQDAREGRGHGNEPTHTAADTRAALNDTLEDRTRDVERTNERLQAAVQRRQTLEQQMDGLRRAELEAVNRFTPDREQRLEGMQATQQQRVRDLEGRRPAANAPKAERDQYDRDLAEARRDLASTTETIETSRANVVSTRAARQQAEDALTMLNGTGIVIGSVDNLREAHGTAITNQRTAQRAVEAASRENGEDHHNEGETENHHADRLEQWLNVQQATANGGGIQAGFIRERNSTRPGGRLYGPEELGNRQEVGYDVSRTVEGTTTTIRRQTVAGAERFRELIFGEAALATGGRFNADRAREAISDETLVRAMVQADGEVAGRRLINGNGANEDITPEGRQAIRTVGELLAEINRLRAAGQYTDELRDNYELRLARSAIPAMGDARWIGARTQDVISNLTFPGIREAARGRSELSLAGTVERRGGIRFENAMDAAYDGVGDAHLERVYDRGRLGMNIDWEGEINLTSGRGPGAEFETPDNGSHPILLARMHIEVRQDGQEDLTRSYVEVVINQGLRQRLPAVLDFADMDDFREQLGLGADVPDATLRYILEHFYRGQNGVAEEQAAEQEGTLLGRYPRVFRFPRVEGRSTAPNQPWADRLTLQQERDGLRLAQELGITQEDVTAGLEPLRANLRSARGVDALTETQRAQLERFAGEDDTRSQQEILDWRAARTMAILNTIPEADIRAEVEVRYMLQQMFPGLMRRLQEAGETERRTLLNRLQTLVPEVRATIGARRLGDQEVDLRSSANGEDRLYWEEDALINALNESDEEVLEYLRPAIRGLQIRRVIPRARNAGDRIANLQLEEARFVPDALEYYQNPQTVEEWDAAITMFERADPAIQQDMIDRMVIARALGVSRDRVRGLSDRDVNRMRAVIERAWAEQDRLIDEATAAAVQINLTTATADFETRYPEEADRIRAIQQQREAFARLPRREQMLRRTLADRELRRMEEADRQPGAGEPTAEAARTEALRGIDVTTVATPANGYATVAEFLGRGEPEVTRMLENQRLLRRLSGLTLQGGNIAENVAVIESLINDRLFDRAIEERAIEDLAREGVDDWDGDSPQAQSRRLRRLRNARSRWRGERRIREADRLTEAQRQQRLATARTAFEGDTNAQARADAIAAMRQRLLNPTQADTNTQLAGRYVLQAAGRGTMFRLRDRAFQLTAQELTGEHPDTGMQQLLEVPEADAELSIQQLAMRNVEIATANTALYEIPLDERVGGRLNFRNWRLSVPGFRGPTLAAFTYAPIDGEVPGAEDGRRIHPDDAGGRVILTNEGIFMFVRQGAQDNEGIMLDEYYNGIIRGVDVTDRRAYRDARQRIQDIQQLVGRQILYSFPRR